MFPGIAEMPRHDGDLFTVCHGGETVTVSRVYFPPRRWVRQRWMVQAMYRGSEAEVRRWCKVTDNNNGKGHDHG